ncbi:MAG: PIG-L family deacetylase [Endomicrobium sp.]|nr:PIG-L family deacetylase [Endomicrobium sp.]
MKIIKKIFRYKQAKETKTLYPKKFNVNPQDKFLILSPHPDDECIGCGGFLLSYGFQCDVVLLTNGCYGDASITPEKNVQIRYREFDLAMKKVNVAKIYKMDIEDTKLIDNFKRFKFIMKTIMYNCKYDYVFMPSPKDAHPDHKAVSFLFDKLKLRNCKKVYYEVWSTLYQPSHFIDISKLRKNKRELINIYESQTKHIDYASRILGLNYFRGMTHNISYEEDYEFA